MPWWAGSCGCSPGCRPALTAKTSRALATWVWFRRRGPMIPPAERHSRPLFRTAHGSGGGTAARHDDEPGADAAPAGPDGAAAPAAGRSRRGIDLAGAKVTVANRHLVRSDSRSRKATPVRSQPNDRQEPQTKPEAAVTPEARRPFPEPVLTKHNPLTRITLVSGDTFNGSGF